MVTPDRLSDTPADLKKRARRRLVGAIALALLAIIVLPVVMNHEPKPASQDIQIKIPSQEPDGVVPHTPSPQSLPPSPVMQTPPKIDAAAPSDMPQVENKTERKLALSATEPQQSAVRSDAASAPVAKPNEKTVPEQVTPVRNLEETHAAAVINGMDERWLVRLGAYQNAANVKQLLAKVKEAGIPAYAEKFDAANGSRTRVLAGPFNSRVAAEKAQNRIKKLGVDGTVMAKQ